MVSVIITTYNEEKNIADCLKSILAQTRKPDEVIVVDDGSQDRTVEVVSKFPTKLIKTEHKERCHARNVGWKGATGDLVFFAEADSVFDKNWIKEILKTFEKGADAVIDRRRMYKPKTFLQKCLEAQFDIRYAHYKPFSAWAFKKQILKDVGGFDEKLNQAEERDLGKRILDAGYKILLAQKAIQYHKGEPQNIKELIKRAYVSARRKATGYFKKYPKEFSYLKPLFFVGLSILLLLSFILLYFLYAFGVLLLLAYLGIYFRITVNERGWQVVAKKYIFGLAFFRLMAAFASSFGSIAGKLSR